MIIENLIEIYASSFKDNWELPALTDYMSDNTMTYGDFARRIARTHIFFKECGVKRGDKIALIGKNSMAWVTIYMATITYGAIIVPILSDFNPQDAQHIINHSDSVMLFLPKSTWENFDHDSMDNVKVIMALETSEVLAEHPSNSGRATKAMQEVPRVFKKKYPNGFTTKDIKYPNIGKDDVIEINYTSGTTGFSKGVMLTANNLCGNVVFGIRSKLHYRGSRTLAFLPLAHAYGCAFDMLVPLAVGTHITLFGKLPTPKLLVKALGEVKPSLIIVVPLILEKIYRKQILPAISKPSVKRLLKLPLINRPIMNKIRQTLIDAFGGEFYEVIVGGAPLNPEVEAFLYKIKFPFTVGYGMTECGPLISYTDWHDFIPTSSGQILPGIMEGKIESPDGGVLGEICVKGDNVMKGYYKNPAATEAVLDKDGWLHTGDMGTISDNNTIFIKGRYKTMILSASGQNIYPEEIEAKLNNMPYVAESLVVERGKGLTALVYPDYEAMDKSGMTSDQLPAIMEENLKKLNSLVAPYEKVSSIQLRAVEFEKTPKKSIKRYLYKD